MFQKIRMPLCILTVFFATALFAQMRIIPHVTRPDGGFTTSIIIENLSVEAASYTLQPFDSDGNSLEPVSGRMEAKTTMVMSSNELFGTNQTASFSIEGDDVLVTAAYVTTREGGSPAHVRETSEEATSYRLFAGDWSVVFDGFAAVNVGTAPANIWVAQRDASGNIVKSVQANDGQPLAPSAKTLFIIGMPGLEQFTHMEGYTYEVYSEQPMALTALRSNIPESTFLWTNQAEPMSHASTTRDAQGVWFIENGSLADVMSAMGYAVANDRLWQMETLRRSARGLLSEWLGSSGLQSDIFERTVGYSENELQAQYQAMAPDAKIAVSAYIDGVNRHIAEVNADNSLMPTEFLGLQFIGVNPLPMPAYTATDSMIMTSALLRQFDPNGTGQGQLANASLLQALQENHPETALAMFEDLRWTNDPTATTMIHDIPVLKAKPARKNGGMPGPLRSDINFRALADELAGLTRNREEVLESLNAKYKSGSYAWVIAGDRTQSGNPILYSGPQMGFMTPSITVEGSIRGGGLNISGMSVPGIAGIIIGRTPHHTWSMQVGMAHTSDLYLEDPATLGDPVRVETIKVNGEEDVEQPIYFTEHGPVLPITSATVAWKYAHRSMVFDTIDAFITLARTESMDEFGEALRNVGVSQHFCYADRDGNIGYWMSGRNPIRPDGEWRLPQGAVAPALEYNVEVFMDLAHDRNSPVGYYGGWNNKAAVSYNNAPFGDFHNYGPFHRANVVNDRLVQLVNRGNVTFDEAASVAVDIAATYSLAPLSDAWPFQAEGSRSFNSGGGNPWDSVGDYFRAAVEDNNNPDRQAALDVMNLWDGHFIDGGQLRWINGNDRADGWMLMDAWLRRTMEYIYDEVELSLGGQASLFNNMIHGLDDNSVLQNNYDWFASTTTTGPQDFDEAVVMALDDTLAALGSRPWGSDQRGFIEYRDNLTGALFHTTPYSSRSTYAHCVEMGAQGPVRIGSMFPLGESGRLNEDGAKAMAPFFDNWDLRNFPLFP